MMQSKVTPPLMLQHKLANIIVVQLSSTSLEVVYTQMQLRESQHWQDSVGFASLRSAALIMDSLGHGCIHIVTATLNFRICNL